MRTALAALVAVATLPYLTLKGLWLTGHPVGVLDPAFLASPGLHAANLATAGMDAVAILLAVVLASGTRRPPAWTVLVPGWVGTGFLVPIVLTTAPGLLLDGGVTAGPEPLAPWVKPLVYVGFTLQGVGLVGLFGRYALERWSAATAPAGAVVPWARTVVRLAAVPAGCVAVFQLGQACGLLLPDGGSWTASAALVAVVKAVLAGAAVLGALAVTGGRSGRGAVVAAAAGSASLFSWGLYGTVMTVTGTVFAASSPVTGIASLLALLAGLVLGTVVLGALAQARSASSTSASKQVLSPV